MVISTSSVRVKLARMDLKISSNCSGESNGWCSAAKKDRVNFFFALISFPFKTRTDELDLS